MRHFLSLNTAEYQTLMKEWGQPAFRGTQIAEWIYKKHAAHPDAMTNLSKDLRQKLQTELSWEMPEIVNRLEAQDGSTKLLLKNARGQMIETVIMRYEGRTSVCVSSQVGCKLACSFCQTGKMGFVSHLGREEILAQIVHANAIVMPEGRRVSHVVFMGMGEPLDNYRNVVDAAAVLMSPAGFHLSNRHVTISTSGMVPKIKELAHESPAALALSLHAANDALRTELMPINRKYDLAELKAALLYYQEVTGKIITLEYILIRNKNCGLTHAKELVRFIHGMRAKVNLIPFNAHPGLPFERPTPDDIRAFQKHLADRSIPAPVRFSKGLEVSAACGQLAAKTLENLHQKPERRSLVRPTAPTESSASL